MTPLLPLWSLHWSSNGELSPLDRQDLLLRLNLPGMGPFHQPVGSTGAGAISEAPRLPGNDLPFPYR
ncbi:MAG: hypothetical protein VKP70_08530 [Cyanobacteriota bacterium]|nr:hypothetical protein [Cyanobacteriota bacterium]